MQHRGTCRRVVCRLLLLLLLQLRLSHPMAVAYDTFFTQNTPGIVISPPLQSMPRSQGKGDGEKERNRAKGSVHACANRGGVQPPLPV